MINLTETIGVLLRGHLYANNSIVSLDNIDNTDSRALLCITNNSQCCNINNGNWYSPSSTLTGYDVSRGPGVVRLKRSNGTPQTGVFRCEISIHDLAYNFYIGLYHRHVDGNNYWLNSQYTSIPFFIIFYAGTPTVTSLSFDHQSQTLTCTSSGGPATTVSWTNNGVQIEADSTRFSQTQIVMQASSATYLNNLAFKTIEIAGNYSCTVSNARGSVSSMTSIELHSKP